ncbi:MAG: hypothetical protein DCF30_09335 [Hyphomicrobiales bacterium]|nr:MAG: hypothetical protein DCF30_09335 [Hyphomicrobiales bacterium]
MARTSLTAAALATLGPEKLSRLVFDEAERNAAFRKQIMAALAAVKGPEAVAKLIDRRLSALERARGFIDWDKAKPLQLDLAATVRTISDELGEVDPASAVERLLRFIATHESIFERVDDSYGRIQDVYETAIADLDNLAPRMTEDRRRLLPEMVMGVLGESTHGYLVDVADVIAKHVPDDSLQAWDQQLAAMMAKGSPATTRASDRARQASIGQLRSLRQAVAEARGDLDGMIAIEAAKHPNMQDTLGIARRLLDAGRPREALTWARKERQPAIRYSSASDLADGTPPRDPLSLARAGLEAEILEALGDKPAAQALRWFAFEATLNADMLRQYIGKLADFEEFEVIDRAFSHVFAAKQSYLALEFFLQWPHFENASRLVIDRRAGWSGSAYYVLAPAADLLDHDHPLAATILYRSLIDDILGRAKSAAYGHGARHLAKLDALAPLIDAEFAGIGLADHAAYRADLRKKHGRKVAFWSVVEKTR